jgi:putative aminopeptidase FrvX
MMGMLAALACGAGDAAAAPDDSAAGGALLSFLCVAAPAGREQTAVAFLRRFLGPGVAAREDAFGNLTLTLGSGGPRHLVVCPLGEPGFIVSGIERNGYLRLGASRQEAPAGALWDQAHEGQVVQVMGAYGEVPGAVAPRSIHLQGATARGRPPFSLADAFVDVGAGTAAEVARLGIRLLDPVTLDRRPVGLAHGLIAGPAARQKGACLAAAVAARRFHPRRGGGTVIFAWTVQGPGATALLLRQAGAAAAAMDVVDLGRAWQEPTGHPQLSSLPVPGTGRLLTAGALAAGGEGRAPAAPSPAVVWRGWRGWSGWSGRREPGAPRVGYLGLPALFPGTPVETVSLADVERLESTLLALLGSPPGPWPAPDGAAGAGAATAVTAATAVAPAANGTSMAAAAPTADPAEAAVAALAASLVAPVGVSGGEGAIRDAIRRQLPPWAHPVVDRLGNLSLTFGGDTAASAAAAPPRVFLAHMDEVGFRVSTVLPDGRLTLHSQGGVYRYLWEAQPALVQGLHGQVPAIFEPRADWLTARSADLPGELTAWTGAASAREVAALGIAAGSAVTMPKQLLRLGLHRVAAHSLDDRLGDTALLLALRLVDPAKVRHRILFAWTVREETGLTGAVFLARQLPAVESVYSVDTFISSDSPRESRPIGRVPLGSGAVLRTGDGSAAPRQVIGRVAALASRLRIPLIVGISIGGTDALPFVYRGGPVLPLGWPGRYSHAPAEVADLRDVEALVRLVAALVDEP